MLFRVITHSYVPTGADDPLAEINGGEWTSPFTSTPVADTAVTTTATLSIEVYHRCTGAADYVVTLPDAALNAGKDVAVECALDATKLLTVKSNGGLVAGAAAATGRIMWTGEVAIFRSNGTNWIRIGGALKPMICTMYLTADSGTMTQGVANAVALNAARRDNTAIMSNTANNRIDIKRPEIYMASAGIGIKSTAVGQNVSRGIILSGAAGATDTGAYGVGSGAANNYCGVSVPPFPLICALADQLKLTTVTFGSDFVYYGAHCYMTAAEQVSW